MRQLSRQPLGSFLDKIISMRNILLTIIVFSASVQINAQHIVSDSDWVQLLRPSLEERFKDCDKIYIIDSTFTIKSLSTSTNNKWKLLSTSQIIDSVNYNGGMYIVHFSKFSKNIDSAFVVWEYFMAFREKKNNKVVFLPDEIHTCNFSRQLIGWKKESENTLCIDYAPDSE